MQVRGLTSANGLPASTREYLGVTMRCYANVKRIAFLATMTRSRRSDPFR